MAGALLGISASKGPQGELLDRKYLEQEVPDIKDFLEDAFDHWRN